MRIPVDWHTHAWLPEHFGGSRSTPAGTAVERGAPSRLRDVMGESVDRYVIVGLQMPWIHIPNEFIAEQVELSEGKAIGFASVDPHHDGAVDRARYALTTLGLRGLKLSPTYQGFDPRSPEVWPLYELADELGVPVMFHVGGGAAQSSTLEHGNPMLLDPVARAFPELRIVVAHLGQPYMSETVILMRKNRHVYADLSARFHRPWQLYNGLVIAKEYGVLDRILFGTDFPVRTPAESLELFHGLTDLTAGTGLPAITREIVDSIVGERPLALLGYDV